jgi:hypothetical protein
MFVELYTFNPGWALWIWRLRIGWNCKRTLSEGFRAFSIGRCSIGWMRR